MSNRLQLIEQFEDVLFFFVLFGAFFLKGLAYLVNLIKLVVVPLKFFVATLLPVSLEPGWEFIS
jgi:hypothetical protein